MFTRLILTFSCFTIVTNSPKSKYLVGNLVLTCHFSLVLLSGNCLLNDCGKCLLYCTSLALCDHFPISFLLEPNCYTLCEIVSGWLWWKGLCSSNPCSQLPCMSPYLLFDPNQHAIMCRMPVGMVDNLHGGWLFTIMMRIFSSPFAAWVAFFVYWGLPLFWLSLLLGRLAASKHDPLWSRFCWQLAVFQIVWDEVKGNNPSVYKDLPSETTIAPFLVFSKDICSLVRWFGTGTRQSYAWQTRRAASRLNDCYRVFGAIDNSVVPFTSSLCCSVGMYCSCNFLFSFSFQLEFPVMFVVERLQCNNGTAVKRIFGCCIPSVIICNVSIFRDLEQHLCVLGMCLMALDGHPWMLRPVHDGRCFQNGTLGPCLTALEQHRRMLGLARRGLGLCLLALDVHPWMLRPGHYGCCFDSCIAFRHFDRLKLSALLMISSAVNRLLTLCLGFRFVTLLFTSYLLAV